MAPIDDSEIRTSGVELQNPGFLTDFGGAFSVIDSSQHKCKTSEMPGTHSAAAGMFG